MLTWKNSPFKFLQYEIWVKHCELIRSRFHRAKSKYSFRLLRSLAYWWKNLVLPSPAFNHRNLDRCFHFSSSCTTRNSTRSVNKQHSFLSSVVSSSLSSVESNLLIHCLQATSCFEMFPTLVLLQLVSSLLTAENFWIGVWSEVVVESADRMLSGKTKLHSLQIKHRSSLSRS